MNHILSRSNLILSTILVSVLLGSMVHELRRRQLLELEIRVSPGPGRVSPM